MRLSQRRRRSTTTKNKEKKKKNYKRMDEEEEDVYIQLKCRYHGMKKEEIRDLIEEKRRKVAINENKEECGTHKT